MRYADGTYHDVMFHKATFDDADGDLAGMIGTILDITTRKQAEQRSPTARRATAPCVDALGEGIVLFARDRRVLACNPAARDDPAHRRGRAARDRAVAARRRCRRADHARAACSPGDDRERRVSPAPRRRHARVDLAVDARIGRRASSRRRVVRGHHRAPDVPAAARARRVPRRADRAAESQAVHAAARSRARARAPPRRAGRGRVRRSRWLQGRQRHARPRRRRSPARRDRAPARRRAARQRSRRAHRRRRVLRDAHRRRRSRPPRARSRSACSTAMSPALEAPA